MLGEISRQQLDEWIAYDSLEPLGQAWLAAGTIASRIDAGFATVLAGLAGQPLDGRRLPRPTDYIPVRRSNRRTRASSGQPGGRYRVDLASIRASEQMAEAAALAAKRRNAECGMRNAE